MWKAIAASSTFTVLTLITPPMLAGQQGVGSPVETVTLVAEEAPVLRQFSSLMTPIWSTMPEARTETADGGDRNSAMINGALIAVGTLGVVDNVVVHWILGWHRAIEGSPYSLQMEIGIVAVSAAMVATGIVRERRSRAATRP